MQPAQHGTQYRLFQAAVIIKGINGVLEIIGGTALMIVGSTRINSFLDMLTLNELEDSPHSFLLKLLTHNGLVRHVPPLDFAILYLLMNGIAKVAIVSALMRRKRKVFPYAIAFLALFVMYGLIRLITHHSTLLAMAMTVDIMVIVLIWREYRTLEREDAAAHAASSTPAHRAATPA